jgi:GMP synthase (glutamine-hydrolysing)
VLVFQHVAHEILGTFHPLLKKARFRIRYVNFGRKSHRPVQIERYDGLIILGGPMGVYEADIYPHLREEMAYIQEAVRLDKPVLGICLGAQLIAAALGAEVSLHHSREVGWYDLDVTKEGESDLLLGELKGAGRIFQWHQDTFCLPKGAVLLASSEKCSHQAFRVGEKVYGFQFHLEVDEAMIARWLQLSRKDPGSICTSAHFEKIEKETPLHIASLMDLSRRVFGRYVDLFSTKRRKILLGSGHS